jgi:hypothetical protein
MVTMITAPAPLNGDNSNPQGHCGRCGKIWVLNERQGIIILPYIAPSACTSDLSILLLHDLAVFNTREIVLMKITVGIRSEYPVYQ